MINSKRIKQRAKFARPLLIPFILYIGLLPIATSWAPTMETPLLRYGIALLPILPGIFLALGTVRAAKQFDELERRILLEAATFSFCFTLILMVSLGLLNVVGLPTPNPMLIAAIMALFLIIGKFWGNWRSQ
ncbi:MAG: hypothetical protein KC423_26430 [Anaerolineales bacterium]|nr:hypothetical protein [Anaerolineales bacterium]MCB9432270.1 hypothetical protein [Ardenticatenaceae bacterium]